MEAGTAREAAAHLAVDPRITEAEAAAAVLPAEAAPEDHPEAAVQRRNLLSQSKV